MINSTRIKALVCIGLLLVMVLVAPIPPANGQSDPDPTSDITFTIGPSSVSPGATLNWNAMATCTGPTGGAQSCSNAGSSVGGPVVNGYTVEVVEQAGSTCTFSPKTTRQTTTTTGTSGSASGSFAAPSTPGTYCYRAEHPSQNIGGFQWAAANSTGIVITVVPIRPTTTSVNCAPNPVPVNAPTTCTATVMDTGSGTPITPTGNVNWSNVGGNFSAPSCALSGSGASAMCSVQYTPNPGTVGTHNITATYPGDSNHSSSSGNSALNVIQRTTSTSVVCNPAAIFLNGNTTCTATVMDTTAAGTAVTPTGMVTFMSSLAGTFSGSPCTLSGSGASASCSATFNATAVGTHTITGTYPGDVNHFGSNGMTSLPVTYNFVGFLPPIMITNPAPGLNGVRAGSTVPAKWQLLDANGAFVTTLAAVVSIQVVQINCSTDEVMDTVTDATATGGTGLRYDSTDNQYVFNWQTQRAWAGTCHRLLLNLNDGTQRSADFQLR